MDETPDPLEGLTEAQAAAVAHRDGPALVLAGAGSGKTRVITRRVAHLMGQGVFGSKILALTFTNKAGHEMRERVSALVPDHKVTLCTFHSLCSRLLRRHWKRVGLDRNFGICDEGDTVRHVKEAIRLVGLDPARFQPAPVQAEISRAKADSLGPGAFLARATTPYQHAIGRVFACYDRLVRTAGSLDFDDLLNLVVQAFATDEGLRAEVASHWKYILVDEYQDTNNPQYRLLRLLTREHQNIMVVGDPDQCLPPDTLVQTREGAKRIDQVREGEHVLSGCGYGKMTFRPVEKVMVNPYRGRMVRITLSNGMVIRATPNHMCFARLTPADGVHYVYLMYRVGYGYRIGITSGVRCGDDRKRKNGLLVRCVQEHADKMWVIEVCDTAAQASYLEQLYSVRYGIHTMLFHVCGRGGMRFSQEDIIRLFADHDSTPGAMKLLADKGLDHRFPHHHGGGSTSRNVSRRKVHLTVFGDMRMAGNGAGWHKHTVTVNSSGEELRQRLIAAGYSIKAGKRSDWRYATLCTNYDSAKAILDSFAEFPELEPHCQAKLTTTGSFHFMPAGNITKFMEVPVEYGGCVQSAMVVDVAHEEYDGQVYDLSVSETRNFVVNGVVVHNSLYSFRGADIRNILGFEEDYPSAVAYKLEANYRSVPAVLAAANCLISHNRLRKEKKLIPTRPAGELVRVRRFTSCTAESRAIAADIVDGVDNRARQYRDHAILVRVHALTPGVEKGLVELGIPYQVVGGLGFFDRKEVKDVLAYLRAALNPADRLSILRVINEPTRGVGKASVDRLVAWADERDTTLLAGCRDADRIDGVSAKAVVGMRQFARAVEAVAAEVAGGVAGNSVRAAVRQTGYAESLIAAGDDDALDRLQHLKDLEDMADKFDGGVVEFLEKAALAAEDDAGAEIDRVQVMTMHAAKGLEFPAVYVVGAEEGVTPHARVIEGGGGDDGSEIEEERRAFFVAVTRAMDQLWITHATARMMNGQLKFQSPSRFLGELPHAALRYD